MESVCPFMRIRDECWIRAQETFRSLGDPIFVSSAAPRTSMRESRSLSRESISARPDDHVVTPAENEIGRARVIAVQTRSTNPPGRLFQRISRIIRILMSKRSKSKMIRFGVLLALPALPPQCGGRVMSRRRRMFPQRERPAGVMHDQERP